MLVPVAAALSEKFDSGDPLHGHRRLCLRALADLCDFIDEGDLIWKTSYADKFEERVNTFLLHYTALATRAHTRRQKLWSMVPKSHYCAHLPQQARYLSPRASWTYGSEDMVGRIARLAHSTTAGTAPQLIASKVIDKYRLALHVAIASSEDIEADLQ
jgi:hypothetical protein